METIIWISQEGCCKTIAAKGCSTTNLFHQLKSHPMQNEARFKLRMSASPHTQKKTLNKPAMTPVTVLGKFFL